MGWMDYLGAAGQVMGGAAQGSAQNKLSEGDLILKQGQLKNQQYTTQQNALLQALGLTDSSQQWRANTDLAQRQFAMDAPQTRAKTSMMGDYMSSFQPMQITAPKGVNMPKISGGATMSDSTRQMGKLLTELAYKQQPYDGDTFDNGAMPDFQGGVLAQPGVPELPKASWMDKLLGGGGLMGSILQALLKAGMGSGGGTGAGTGAYTTPYPDMATTYGTPSNLSIHETGQFRHPRLGQHP